MYEYIRDRLDDLISLLEKIDKIQFDIDYHKNLISDIQINRKTDISISFEASKAMVVGLLKSMLDYKGRLNTNLNKKGNIVSLFTPCLKEYSTLTDDGSIETWIKDIKNNRNTGGDLCHGRNPADNLPKLSKSKQIYYVEICSSLYRYLLDAFIEEIELDLEEKVIYSENDEFNNFLDDEEAEFNHILIEKGIEYINYSELFYNQDYEKYKIELEEFLESKEEIAKDKEQITIIDKKEPEPIIVDDSNTKDEAWKEFEDMIIQAKDEFVESHDLNEELRRLSTKHRVSERVILIDVMNSVDIINSLDVIDCKHISTENIKNNLDKNKYKLGDRKKALEEFEVEIKRYLEEKKLV